MISPLVPWTNSPTLFLNSSRILGNADFSAELVGLVSEDLFRSEGEVGRLDVSMRDGVCNSGILLS